MKALLIALLILPIALVYIAAVWYIIKHFGSKEVGKNAMAVYRRKLYETLLKLN
jgi:hypothetical protein